MHLLLTEMRRALHRRLVWILIGLAIALSLTGGLIAFLDSAGGLTAAHLRGDDPHPAVMANWWVAGGGESWIAGGAFFLLIGGMIGGASVAGAEWRFGTVATTLTWEPRRSRLLTARIAAAALLAAAIALALQVVSLVLLMPAVALNGTSAGTDLDWWIGLGTSLLRVSALTALAAVLGLAIANLGRNTTAALASICGWLLVVEGLIRALRPGWSLHLLSENIAVVLTWAPLDGDVPSHSPGRAVVTLVAYTALPVLAALAVFHRRDLVA
jgi:ABC-2 type transport system permease protein